MTTRSELEALVEGIKSAIANGNGTYSSVAPQLQNIGHLIPPGYSMAVVGTVEVGWWLRGRLGIELGAGTIVDSTGDGDTLFSIAGIAKNDTAVVDFGVEVHLIKGNWPSFTGFAVQGEVETPWRIFGFNGAGGTIPFAGVPAIPAVANSLFAQGDIVGSIEKSAPGTALHFVSKPTDFDANGDYIGEPSITFEIQATISTSQINDILEAPAVSIAEFRDDHGWSVRELFDFANENPGDFLEQWLLNPCFASGTPILLADGTSRVIEDILPGDTIAAFDETEGQGRADLRPATVARLLPGVTEEWIVLEGTSSASLRQDTRVTPGHRYLTEHGTWMAAADLIASDVRAVAADGSLVPLRGTLLRAADAGSDAGWITPESYVSGNTVIQPAPVFGWRTYNFEVAELHTYVAANDNCPMIEEAAA